MFLQCVTILVARKEQKRLGNHFIVGVWSTCANKESVPRRLRGAFPEFQKSQSWVTFHRTWSKVCQYILKGDHEPFVWGEQSLEARKKVVMEGRGRKKNPTIRKAIIEKFSLV